MTENARTDWNDEARDLSEPLEKLSVPVHVLTEHYIVMSRPNLGRNVYVVDPFSGEEADFASFFQDIEPIRAWVRAGLANRLVRDEEE